MSTRRGTLWAGPLAVLLAGLLAGCATEPAPQSVFDGTATSHELVVLGDGFVRTGARRIPLEAAVLELRLQTRALPPAERNALVVHVRLAPSPGPTAPTDWNRLLRELEILGIKQLRLL